MIITIQISLYYVKKLKFLTVLTDNFVITMIIKLFQFTINETQPFVHSETALCKQNLIWNKFLLQFHVSGMYKNLKGIKTELTLY